MWIGVTGLGRIGVTHARNLAATPGVDGLVFTDPVPGRAEAAAALLARNGSADAPEVRVVGDLTTLLAGVDGVLVATPTPTHAEVVHRSLDAGVPTLCEKPIAGDLATMTAVIEHAERSGTPLLVGFQRRFDPAIQELKRRIDGGELGDLYLVRAIGMDAVPPGPAYIPTSGGIFRDLFIHDLDAVPWLVGRPVDQVHAVGSVLVDAAFAANDDVDTAVITLTFAGGVIAQLAGGRRDGGGYDHRIEVIGSRQALTAGLDGRSPITSVEPGGHDPGDQAYPGFVERFARAYAHEARVFVDVVAGGAGNPSPARDSLVSLVLAEACERSRRCGQPVRPVFPGTVGPSGTQARP
jgi:myo-inositol 2-dehydrogenase/D-chiro-inositol 1-dehydrogenase